MSHCEWTRICRLDELKADEGTSVTVQGQRLGVFLVDGQACVLSDVCPHGEALLSHGWVEDGVVECPLHQARFDLRTGRVLTGPAKKDVTTFEVRVQDGQLLAVLHADETPAHSPSKELQA